MTAVLEVTDLRTCFTTWDGVVKAVDGVSFSLAAGEVLGVVGESGSGKSITGFSIIGLLDDQGRIAGGSIRLKGRELVGLPPRELRKIRGKTISMVFQDPMMTLNPVLSVFTQMYLALKAHEHVSWDNARARCLDVLKRVGIPAPESRLDAFPHQLSGGMRQRIAIAIALLHRPEVIIADEPTTALDVSIQAQILVEMKSLVDELGTAMIWISHDLSTVSSIAKRIAVMYAGKIVEIGPAWQVLSAPRHPYTVGLLGSLPSRADKPGQKLVQIPGSTPPLINLPRGCAFAPRCSRADPRCTAGDPPLTEEPGRAFSCFNPEDVGGGV
ncbi:MAG: ABC transporter ATP-binding protein [Methylobacteriaceae bacterium]|jgi:peptide/nickel transport system ATP-binding protein|nr:ABC transporter ATP-binding protein [Methylobacteriaceae bacterium]